MFPFARGELRWVNRPRFIPLQCLTSAPNEIGVMRIALRLILVALGHVFGQDVTFTSDALHDRHLIPSVLYGVNAALAPGSWVDLDPTALHPVVADIAVQTDQWTILLPLSSRGEFYR
jgi:hypothetical protein